MIKNNKIEKVKKMVRNREIKKEIKKELSTDQKVSATEVLNFLKEYKKSIKTNRNNRDYVEIDKANMNLSILNARIIALGRRNSNKYYNLALERLEVFSNFFFKKEEMIYRTKLFLAEMERLPKTERTYDVNFMKSMIIQSTFNVEKNFNKIFKELMTKSHKTSNISEFYVLLDISCKKLDNLFNKLNSVYIN